MNEMILTAIAAIAAMVIVTTGKAMLRRGDRNTAETTAPASKRTTPAEADTTAGATADATAQATTATDAATETKTANAD